MPDYNRYLAIMAWARKRWTTIDEDGRGWLPIRMGGEPTVYTRVEMAAARRYLGMA